jgi:outer membrane protein OmpA-like peptidoglycan-associated protein
MHILPIAVATLVLAAADAGEFQLKDNSPAKGVKSTKPANAKLEPTKTDAAIRFYVVEKEKGPIKGIVVCMTSPTGTKYFTEETDAEGFAEVLVPVGAKYEVTYLTLGRKDVAASVNVTSEPKQSIKLTLRYTPRPPPPPFVVSGIEFDTGKATLREGSTGKLDIVVEYMTHRKSAQVEISGHTDNAGKPAANKTLSEKRAQSCRAYLISKGIDGSRITAVGYGQERPIAPNDTQENRQKNRRIEVVELLKK